MSDLPAKLAAAGVTVRHEQRFGDIGDMIRLHGVLYGHEHGYGLDFEGYVARTFAAYAWPLSERERLWIVEKDGAFRGSIAIVKASDKEAQLRWLLLHPTLRGLGLGRWLVSEAVEWSYAQGYSSVILWTEASLTPAITLYKAQGFVRAEEKTSFIWGAVRTEERYDLRLRPD